MVTEKTHENKLRALDNETKSLLAKKEKCEQEIHEIQARLDTLKTLRTRLESHYKKLQKEENEYAQIANSIVNGTIRRSKTKKGKAVESDLAEEQPKKEEDAFAEQQTEDPPVDAFVQFMEM